MHVQGEKKEKKGMHGQYFIILLLVGTVHLITDMTDPWHSLQILFYRLIIG